MGCAWIVVERAYTVHPLLFGAAPRWRHRYHSSASSGPANASMDSSLCNGWSVALRVDGLPMCSTSTPRGAASSISPTRCGRSAPATATACATSSCRTPPPASRSSRPAPAPTTTCVDTLERLLPRDDRYRHAHGSPGHGADHVLPALVAPSVTVPVQEGEPLLGTWQSVVLVDLNRDNPRRSVRLSFINA